MASALTLKSGGTLAVKSGATMSIKDAGLPPYVIEGLEQSHWMVSNAAVSGGQVASIPDVYGSNVSMTPVDAAWRCNYAPSGWSLNGKTLPTMSPSGSGFEPEYTANGWATKLASWSGAWTVISLMDMQYSGSETCLTFYADGNGNVLTGYGRTTSYAWNLSRTTATGHTTAQNGAGAKGKQIVVQEYTGINAATALGQFRLWINGNLQTLSTATSWGANGGRSLLTGLNKFYGVGGSSYPLSPSAKWAHLHIYKGSLTDAQRNQVTNYLKSISGIV